MNEKKFITECIRTYSGNINTGRIEKLYRSVNLRKLDEIIIQQNIAGFFYHLYTNNIFQKLNIPPEMTRLWKETAGKNSIMNEVNDKEALWLAGILNKNNIDYIYLKGLSTRMRCYNNDYIKCTI